MKCRWSYCLLLLASIVLMHGCTTKRIESAIGVSPALLAQAGQLSYEEFVKQWMPHAIPLKRAHVLADESDIQKTAFEGGSLPDMFIEKAFQIFTQFCSKHQGTVIEERDLHVCAVEPNKEYIAGLRAVKWKEILPKNSLDVPRLHVTFFHYGKEVVGEELAKIEEQQEPIKRIRARQAQAIADEDKNMPRINGIMARLRDTAHDDPSGLGRLNRPNFLARFLALSTLLLIQLESA